jgi:hypothetical protein
MMSNDNIFWDANSPAGSGQLWSQELVGTGLTSNNTFFSEDAIASITNDLIEEINQDRLTEAAITGVYSPYIPMTISTATEAEPPPTLDMELLKDMIDRFDCGWSFCSMPELDIEVKSGYDDIHRPTWNDMFRLYMDGAIDRGAIFQLAEGEYQRQEHENINKKVHDILKSLINQ